MQKHEMALRQLGLQYSILQKNEVQYRNEGDCADAERVKEECENLFASMAFLMEDRRKSE